MTEEVEDLDTILTGIGLGRWQLLTVVSTLLDMSLSPTQLFSSTFINAPVGYRCKDSESVITDSINGDYDNSCFKQDEDTFVSNSSIIKDKGKNATNKCHDWEFDNSVYETTFTSEFDLVCDSTWISTLFQLMLTIGVLFGDIVGGPISDRLGRVWSLRLGTILYAVCVITIGVVPFYWMVLLARTFTGLATSIVMFPAYTLAMETIPPGPRPVIGILLGVPYCLSEIVLGCLAWFIRDWRTLHLTASCGIFIMLPIVFLIDESPRWLVQAGRLEEAAQVLIKANKINNGKLPEKERLITILTRVYEKQPRVDVSKTSRNGCSIWSSLVRGCRLFLSTPAMRRISIVNTTIWFLMGVIYFGIPLNAHNFTSNPFLYLALAGGMELLPSLFGSLIIKRMGNVTLLVICYSITGLGLLCVLGVYDEIWWVKWILVMVSMVSGSLAYSVSFIYISDLYPTSARVTGCNIGAFASHVGFFAATFITSVLVNWAWWLPNVTFGLCGLLSAMLVCLLPETRGLPLCETVKDVEDRATGLNKRKAQKSYQSFQVNEDNKALNYFFNMDLE